MAKDKRINEKYNIKTGFFEDGLPYGRMGNKKNILVYIEALTFRNEPPSGFIFKRLCRKSKLLMEEYTIFIIGRKSNIPEDYKIDDMANDYAKLIRREFKGPVDIMGVSTGGQIAHYIAADHPDVVRKLVIISAAYRLSEKGAEIEGRSAKSFMQGKYGRSLAIMMELVFAPGLKRSIIKFFIRLLGKRILGKIEYPNDFLLEVKADREMNFKERLKEIKAPTLVISGVLDICYTANDVRTTAEGIPNAELILYKGYGHNLAGYTNKVHKDIIAFLKK